MKNLLLIIFMFLTVSTFSQTKVINYWNWSNNHLKQEPQKWNRYDYWNYMPRYYVVPTISFTLKPFKYQKPSNYFYYREKNRKYKFIF